MNMFTIDDKNNITAFGTVAEAAAATATPFDTFASQQDLAELAAGWPAERLVAIWHQKLVAPSKTSQRAAGASPNLPCPL